MAKRNLAKTIERWQLRIDPRYDLCQKDFKELLDQSRGETYSLMANLFILGYAQGFKAAEAERRG